MSKLLTEALADARAVKATAFANAKAAIEESFQPSLQRMISAKLSEEDEFEDDEEESDSDDSGFGSFEDELGGEDDSEDEVELEGLMRELDDEDDEMTMEGEDYEDDEMTMEGEDYDEDDMAMEGEDYDEDDMAMEGEEEDYLDPIPENDEMSDDDEIYEMIMREMDDEDDEMTMESTEGGGAFEDDVPTRSVNSENRKLRKRVKQLSRQKNEAFLVVSKLKKTINEVNLLNAKLLYNTKVTRQYDLDKKQRTTVLENLDRGRTVHEVKLVYATICQSLNKTTNLKKQGLREGFASKSTPTIRSRQLNESTNMVARWQELANIKFK